MKRVISIKELQDKINSGYEIYTLILRPPNDVKVFQQFFNPTDSIDLLIQMMAELENDDTRGIFSTPKISTKSLNHDRNITRVFDVSYRNNLPDYSHLNVDYLSIKGVRLHSFLLPVFNNKSKEELIESLKMIEFENNIENMICTIRLATSEELRSFADCDEL